MSIGATTQSTPAIRPPAASPPPARRRSRFRGGGQSLLAHGEPILWLNGAGLAICLLMIAWLLGLILIQGLMTFWPATVVQIKTIDDRTLMGEICDRETYSLKYSTLSNLSGSSAEVAGTLLHGQLWKKLDGWRERLRSELSELQAPALQSALSRFELAPAVRDAVGAERTEFLRDLKRRLEDSLPAAHADLEQQIQAGLAADRTGQQLFATWSAWKTAEQNCLDQPTLAEMRGALEADHQVARQIVSSQVMSLLSLDVEAPMHRRFLRTGNFELTNTPFAWISDFEIADGSELKPEWALLFERREWGRFYGFPTALLVDEQPVADQPAEVWAAFQQRHREVRQNWHAAQRLIRYDLGHLNGRLESLRLGLRRVDLRYGADSAEWRDAQAELQERTAEIEVQRADIQSRIDELEKEIARYQLVVTTAEGQEQKLRLADIVRAYPPNQLSVAGSMGIYLSRWAEFLTDDPREANSEGGVLPAIWGTVAMTLLMTAAVVPFGVMAALYLREYAKAGLVVSMVRIAVNNLAGVPSIVFGVFGLGFFCYIIGARIDHLLFESNLPSPTFGTGGLMWAALTLSLLTLPVVIVATEEALAAVPRSMREGSLACGATKWQTIRRIVLPRAMPGIMTGTILAMARGAGEVAPLMLVGAVKIAPTLPVDGEFPFVHLQRSFMHLGFYIYDLALQSPNTDAAKPMVFTTTLLLIAIIAFMNLLAIWLRARLRKKFEYSHF